jgi:ribosome maturation factor RimP
VNFARRDLRFHETASAGIERPITTLRGMQRFRIKYAIVDADHRRYSQKKMQETII